MNKGNTNGQPGLSCEPELECSTQPVTHPINSVKVMKETTNQLTYQLYNGIKFKKKQ